jgi:DNA-binding beta-propeller fold protein YncE
LYVIFILLASSFILLLFSYLGIDNVNAESLVDSIKVPSNPQHMLSNPANGKKYVINWNSENIYEIDATTKILVDVFYLNGAKYIAHNPANRNMYASSGWNDTVNVISMRSMTLGKTCSCPTNSTQHWDKFISG